MKLRFQKGAIVNGISIITKAIPSKTTVSIPECILTDASTNEIRPTGNDMELGIKIRVEGGALEHGRTVLDTKPFFEITRGLSSENASVTIESDDKFSTVIGCENSVFNIQGRDGEEFTRLPYIEKDEYICLSQFTLKEIIRQTVLSISPNNSGRVMAGELLEIDENQLKVVSLDGHRISTRKVRLEDHYEGTKVIIPGEALSGANKILGGGDEERVLIYLSTSHILFEFDNIIVVSRLIEGEYFRISQMPPGDYETKISVNKKEFLDCIEQVVILIREDDKKPSIIDVGGNLIELKLNFSFGSMNADLVIYRTSKDITIGFSPKSLIDALRAINDEETSIYIVNPESPCFIKDEEENYIYLIFPVNLNTTAV